MSALSASWSVSQRAVLAEMGLPLYRMRGATSGPPVAAEHPDPTIAGAAVDPADLQRTRWFAQLRAFLPGIDIEMHPAPDGVELCIGDQPPLLVFTPLPTAAEKRALYRAAKAALRGRH